MSLEEWRSIPSNTDASGHFIPPPTVPVVPPFPTASNGQERDERRHDRELKEMLRIKSIRKEVLDVLRRFKELLLNPEVVG